MSRYAYLSNVLLNLLMENSCDIITVKDISSNYLICNKAFYTITGITEDVVGKNIKDVLDIETSFIIMDKFKEVIECGKGQVFTLRVNQKIYTQTLSPIYEDGAITKIIALSHDVTSEENFKLKLLEKICQFNTLMEHIPMPVYMKDKNCNYITGSKFAKAFVDKGIDIYSGDIHFDLEFNSQNTLLEDKAVMKNKQALEQERKLTACDGTEHWYRIYKAPIIDGNDIVSGLVTIAKNINKEKQLEVQKELFLATLTHDLKNPVQAQLMSLKMLSNGAFGDLTPQQKDILAVLIESANYMHEMLQSILTTYKFDNGVINLEKRLFNPAELMNNCINEVKSFAHDKNIKIVTEFKTDGKFLNADINQLRRVISNLLNNALNYSFKDSILKVSLINDGVNFAFGFENSSPEIPDEIKAQIFEKYVSGAQNFKITGIGLGLYFSKKVVEAHDGRIYLEGNGTSNKFIFEIPLENCQKAAIKW